MSQITQEKLVAMLMDMEGADGRVTEDDFKVPYMKMHPDTKPEEYAALWQKIDKDGDGNLDCEELAEHFGFKFSDLAKDMAAIEDTNSRLSEMSDDQILEALLMEQTLRDLKKEEEDLLAKGTKPQRKARLCSRDEEVKVIKMPTKITCEKVPDEVELLMACEAGMEQDIIKLIEKGTNVRIEEDKGEMPLHKVCRHGSIKCVRAILDASEKISKGSKVKDLNMSDRKGKTPLMISAEYKHEALMSYLLDCGANLKAEMSNGWNILHVVVNANNRDLLSKFLLHNHVVDQKKRLFLSTDADQRTPMHIAAFRCDEDIVNILVSNGARLDLVDNAGNNPIKLAERSGRRKSREIMENHISNNAMVK